MDITKNIEIIDLALYLKKQNILILADFHIGYEEYLHKKGMLVPKFQFKDTIKRLEKILAKKYDKIIINGDLKHEFAAISKQEWSETIKLIGFLSKKCEELILIKGNHDKILGPIAEKKALKLVKEYREPGLLIIHGDIIPKKLEKTIIIAHEHPAVKLLHEGRAETYKCFLKGKYKTSALIVMPSFNLVTEGSNILTEERLSPFLDKDMRKFKNDFSGVNKAPKALLTINNFDVFIVGDTIYEFGKVKKLKVM